MALPSLRHKQRQAAAMKVAHRFEQGESIQAIAESIQRRPSLIRRLLIESGMCVDCTALIGVAEAQVTASLTDRYQQGETLDQLSQVTGMDHRQIRLRLGDAVVLQSPRAEAPADIGAAVASYKAGVSIREIATEAGSSYGATRTALLKAGVILRRRGRHVP